MMELVGKWQESCEKEKQSAKDLLKKLFERDDKIKSIMQDAELKSKHSMAELKRLKTDNKTLTERVKSLQNAYDNAKNQIRLKDDQIRRLTNPQVSTNPANVFCHIIEQLKKMV